MLCKEKGTLFEIYVLTARKYADVVSRLSEDVGYRGRTHATKLGSIVLTGHGIYT
jgi:hypothetical protein